MNKKLFLAVMAIGSASLALAQNTKTEQQAAKQMDESAFTFTEAQLGEDENMATNVTILNSTNNVYASGVGYLFSPMRYRYRAFNQKYNDVFINGAPMNDTETGQFRYSMVGGLNQQTRNVDFSLPFESNSFTMANMAGSNNYDFRAGSMAQGHRLTLSGANRNYTLRGMYTYGSGFNDRGWAFAANVTYRWAHEGYVEGTFYNALSYFLGVQKKWNNGHSLSFSTWGNPTERSSQGAATDETYWLANDFQYNPYWGYQNGHKRNSRVVNDFAPSAILTWDWDIDQKTRLVTSLFGKYSMYKSTKLNYQNSENPQPDYWKNLPSSYADVWGGDNTEGQVAQWQSSVDYWRASKMNRQIQWDRLYYANKQMAAQGADAMYYLQAKRSNTFNMALSSTMTRTPKPNHRWLLGFNVITNSDRHYQTLEDLLGATSFHNINSYAVGNYATGSQEVQYDLNTAGPDGRGRLVRKGDTFGYDYRLYTHKGNIWSSYAVNSGRWHLMVAGRMGGELLQRNGYMRNGLFANNSYGKSGVARFGEMGGKGAITFNAGRGHTLKLGFGYQWNAPLASTAFVSPEMENDFVKNLKDEHVLSSEFAYDYSGSWLHASLNAYYSRLDHVTEWQNFYFDDINSFSYVSLTGIEKEYYGVELGLNFKVTSFLDIKALGSYAEAKNVNNSNVTYLNSTSAVITTEKVYNKNMREAGTPLTTASLGLSFHQGGWYIDLNGNYYDRIYLSYSPSYRYDSSLKNRQAAQGNVFDPVTGDFAAGALDQAKGHGGFMLDGSIGKSIYLKHGSLSINFMVTNILNNQKLVTGGYEQSRSDYTASGNVRTYLFSRNPKKYYAFGTNGMLNLAYKF